jgi:diaminopimelate epimerase
VLLEGGVEYDDDAVYPVSGLRGNLLRLPLVGVSIGISSIAKFRSIRRRSRAVDHQPPRAALGSGDGDGSSTTDADDLIIGTKVRIAREDELASGVWFRFATKLPNAGNESGLGLDTTDFFASVLRARRCNRCGIVGNIGLGILGDPTNGNRQNDVVLYGVSFARALTNAAEVVGEVTGRANTRGAGRCRAPNREASSAWVALHLLAAGVRTERCCSAPPTTIPVSVSRRVHLRVYGVPGAVTGELHVAKAHAYGNDFLLDRRAEPSSVARSILRTCPALCARHTGVGGDGDRALRLDERGATMRLFNADGSRSELSGNGLRCLAALIAAAAIAGAFVDHVETSAGTRRSNCWRRRRAIHVSDGALVRRRTSRNSIFRCSTNRDRVGPVGRQPAVRRAGRVAGRESFQPLRAGAVDPRVFPAGTNVEFAHVEAPDRVRILIWERGVGPRPRLAPVRRRQRWPRPPTAAPRARWT